MPEAPIVEATDQGVVLRTAGHTLRIDMLTEGIARVRKYPGDTPPRSWLIRYGFFRDEWPPVRTDVQQSDDTVTLTTKHMTFSIGAQTGALALHNAAGDELLKEYEPAMAGPKPGMRLRFALPPDRKFFGLGDQTRERIEHRGTKGDLWVRNVKSYIPIPLVLASDGVGLLMNTTHRTWFDLGATSPEWFGFEAEDATLDYFVLVGKSPKDLLVHYTDLTGRPPMPPKWALGLWFICRTQADAREFMDDCSALRAHDIPCDAISLEPGWMAKNYDFSIDKDWHPDRFPIPNYAKTGRHNFFPAARRMGFKPGLWLCCDYDLSFEEERRLGAAAETPDEEASAFAEGHEIDEHFEHDRRLDTLTRPDQAWFEHLKQFVDQGAEWFKQDGANQVINHPDRLYGNGMRDDEMHNLNPLLYSKQMYLGFKEHTGRRPFAFTVSGWAGLQRWTGTWTGDTGGEEGPLGAVLNLSLSGHGMSTCDMEVTTREGIHFGLLLPWAQLNSWNYWRHPWYQGKELQKIFTDYTRLRYRLLPYLYGIAWEAHTYSTPMLRAMPLEFPDDPECNTLIRQYMFGPALLVGAFTDRVYLPAGEWFDFWTGERYTGPKWVEPQIPADRGGPLLVRAGAIIPMGQVMNYVDEKPDDQLTIHIFAGADGTFTLYEDNGSDFSYQRGARRTTEIRHTTVDGALTIELAAGDGTFDGAVQRRSLTFVVHGIAQPQSIELDGTKAQWTWDEATATATVAAGERPVDQATTLVVRS